MKLLNCTSCHDIVKLRRDWRPCACGRARGRYLLDGLTAEVAGHGRVLALPDSEYRVSVRDHRATMELHVLPDSHARVRRVRKQERA